MKNIKTVGLSLALGIGFLVAGSTEANAQYRMGNGNREVRQERREDRRDARQDGYNDGLREGAEDARAGRRSAPMMERDYRRAGGENNRQERMAYQNGFIRGYNEAYARNRRTNGNRVINRILRRY